MEKEYRRQITAATWHSCSNCSQWPTENYLTLTEEPRTHQMCNECLCKENQNNCSGSPVES
jgi:hypothetical protein